MADQIEILADAVAKAACASCATVVDVSNQTPLSVMACPTCGAKFMVPGKIGQFLLLKCLGKGGMGATYKALDKILKRNVAIKIMHRGMGDDPVLTESFFSEARSLAALNHPNIVQIYTLGDEKGQPYIVMEFLAGGQMDRLFTREQPMDEIRALDIAIDIAEALKATNDIGMTHGDVKPANILLNHEGTPKLVDFGIARFAEMKHAVGSMGTPYYLAPEQARHERLDCRADIYSLGASLFHALAGRPPFEGDKVDEVIAARLTPPVPDLFDHRPDLCSDTLNTIEKMMQISPEDRYQTYYELLTDLAVAHKAAGKRALELYLAAQQAHEAQASQDDAARQEPAPEPATEPVVQADSASAAPESAAPGANESDQLSSRPASPAKAPSRPAAPSKPAPRHPSNYQPPQPKGGLFGWMRKKS